MLLIQVFERNIYLIDATPMSGTGFKTVHVSCCPSFERNVSDVTLTQKKRSYNRSTEKKDERTQKQTHILNTNSD